MLKSRLIYYVVILLFYIPLHGNAQSGNLVTGSVKDSKGEVIPGVSVVIKGTTLGTTTDANGEFKLETEGSESVLVFSFVGFRSTEIRAGSQTQFDITLEEDVSTLNEVVVIGYGEAKKSDLTGAVSQVKAAALSPTIATSVDNLLKGRVAGLVVMSPSGQPGIGTTIRIRGTNSFAGGSDPLLVVDGLPVGDAGNLKQINPSDIETIDVLKDASATAIYGSRGANGVIMVTTKRGKAGQNTIEGNYQFGLSTLQKPLNIVRDPYLYAQLQNEGAGNYDALFGTSTQRYVGAVNPENGVYYPSLIEIQNGNWKSRTNWVDQIFHSAAQTQNASIAARGGSENTQYSISAGYLGQQGLAIGNNYNRYTANLNLDQKIRKNVKAGANVNVAFVDQTDPSIAGNIVGNIGRSPVFPVYDTIGNYFRLGPLDYGNPVAYRNKVLDKSKSFDLFASTFVEWEIIKGLKFRTNLRTRYGASRNDYYEPNDFQVSGQYNGYARINTTQNTSYVIDNYLTYTKVFAEKHNVTMMLGNSYQKDRNLTTQTEGKGFVNDVAQDRNMAAATTLVVNNPLVVPFPIYPFQLNSYFGRLNYIFDERYLLTATMRADGSSKFGSDNKWGYFPSVGAGWNIHNESFFPQSNVVNTVKLRAGWGLTGNQNALSPFQTQDRLSSGRYWMDGAWQITYGPGVPGPQDQQSRVQWEGLRTTSLKWETTRQVNIGVDLSLLNQRLRVTFEYYDKYTHGLLRQQLVPPTSGFNRKWANNGEISNKGIELALDADIIEHGDFSWSAGLNLSHNKNVVISAEQSTDSQGNVIPSPIGQLIEAFRSQANTLGNGQPLFEFYGYKTNGIVQQGETAPVVNGDPNSVLPGEIKFVDVNGDGVVNDLDRRPIGNPNPTIFFGFNTNLQYRNFQLRLFLTGNAGNKIYNTQKLNQATSQYQRWTPDNATNSYPSLLNNRAYLFSDYFVEDGSYVKIQNVSLSYNVKLNPSSLLKSLRLNVNVENVWQFTKFSGYDPELVLNVTSTSGGYGVYNGPGYPRARQYTMGVNFTF